MAQGIFHLDHLDSVVDDYLQFEEWVVPSWRDPARVDLSRPCIEWGRCRDGFGYGMVRYKGKVWRTHRLAVYLAGRRLKPGECVLHGCDNPPCFSPAHLWIGTKAQNSRDRDVKGRHLALYGKDHWHARFSADDVAKMRQMRAQGRLLREIAAAFSTSTSTVGHIVRGQSRMFG
jgi:hypothetical protein